MSETTSTSMEIKALAWAQNIIEAFDKGVYKRRFFHDRERIKYLANMLVKFAHENIRRRRGRE